MQRPSGGRPQEYRYYLPKPGERPDSRRLLAFLWRDDHDVGTDGDSHTPASRD